MVECEAREACEVSAKADASFAAQCTPPSVDIKFTFAANASAEAQTQLTYALGQLELRLPRLLAAVKKSEFVIAASSDLADTGTKAIRGFLKYLMDGDVSIGVAYKAGVCAPAQLEPAATAVATAGEGLVKQVSAATSVTAALGLGG